MLDINHQRNTGSPPDRGNAFYDRKMTLFNQPGALWLVLDDPPQDRLLSWTSLAAIIVPPPPPPLTSTITNTIKRILFPTPRNPLGACVENHIQHDHKTI